MLDKARFMNTREKYGLWASWAVWAYLQPGGGIGIPVNVGSNEGWIVDNLGT